MLAALARHRKDAAVNIFVPLFGRSLNREILFDTVKPL
jgi:hypothetical protein